MIIVKSSLNIQKGLKYKGNSPLKPSAPILLPRGGLVSGVSFLRQKLKSAVKKLGLPTFIQDLESAQNTPQES